MERVANMHNAFQVQGPIPAGAIVLVDDLMTTGATLDAAASVLEQAGGNVRIVATALRREVFPGPTEPT